MSLNSNHPPMTVSASEKQTGKFRFVILTVLSVGIAINYIDRAAMSVAFTDVNDALLAKAPNLKIVCKHGEVQKFQADRSKTEVLL